MTESEDRRDDQHNVCPVPISAETLAKLTVPEIKAELTARNAPFVSKHRKPELLLKLRSSLHLPVVAPPVKKLGTSNYTNTSGTFNWNSKHPAWILLHSELTAGNIPLEMKDMGPREVHDQYAKTMEFQMESMEYGDLFCKRLHEVREKVKNEIPVLKWNQEHPARRLLYDEIKAGRIPLEEKEMSAAEVYYNYYQTLEFQMRGMEYDDTFARRLKDLRTQMSRDKTRASEDEEAFKVAIKNNPVPQLNHKGKPQWNGSLAQKKLEKDMKAGKHTTMAPQELWASCRLYKEALDKDDFRWKIRQMTRTKKYLHTLEHDAETKLKAHLGIVFS